MKILLTGGAGYIGSHTTVALLTAGYNVVVLDDFSNSSPEAVRRMEKLTGKAISLYEANAADKAKVFEILKREMPESIIHFAGLKAVGESVEKPVEYYRNNIDTTLTLLECMRDLGLSRFVFSSSATVYGEAHTPPFTEEMTKGSCTNPYGWTKWIQEQILADAQEASEKGLISGWKTPLSVVMLRYFNPVGSHESGLIGEDPQGIPNNLMPFISQVAVGMRDKLIVFGDDYDTPDGTCRRDYIHVMDLAEGHVKAAEYAAAHEGIEVFNLGSGKPYSVLEMVEAFSKACGHDIAYEIGARRAGDIQDSWANAEKAKRLLGWEAKRGIEEICHDAWKWQSQNPNGYGE
ncbi:MAG: UDP-glucose 4-epimerase GalE [Mogibacterium sp.]|nr:UDP-glucose 4-epimerase GalE [Mogibacterium sp.]